MSKLLRIICGNCAGEVNLPKASVSTNYSAKNELKVPMTHMSQNPLNKKFDILTIKDDQLLILQKSIFRIMGHVSQSFYSKHGFSVKKKSKSLVKSKISLNSMSLSKPKFSEDLVAELNLKMLMNTEEGFFSNEKVLRKFIKNKNIESCNFAVFYSGSFAIQSLKNELLKKCDYFVEISTMPASLKDKKHLDKQLIYSDTFKLHSINCDVVYLDLMESDLFYRDVDKKAICLRTDKIKNFIIFMRSVLEKANKCVLFLSNETFIEDFVEVFDEALLNEDLQRKFGTYCLEIEGIYYEEELECLMMTFQENKQVFETKEMAFVVNSLLQNIVDQTEKNSMFSVFEGIISRIGMRKTLHFLYEAENNTQHISIHHFFLRKVINEDLLENEEAFQLRSFRTFSQNEFFEELSLKKSLIRLTENPKIIKSYFDARSNSSKTLTNLMGDKKDEIVSFKSKGIDKASNEIHSFEKGDDSQILSDYSFQKSEKNFELDILGEIKKDEEEQKENHIFFDFAQH